MYNRNCYKVIPCILSDVRMLPMDRRLALSPNLSSCYGLLAHYTLPTLLLLSEQCTTLRPVTYA